VLPPGAPRGRPPPPPRQVGRTSAMAEYLQTVNAELRETVVELSRARAEKQNAVLGHEESRATLDVVLAGAPVGIALVDRALRYERVNDAFADLGGGAAASYRERAVGDVTPPLAAVLVPAIAKVLETERPQLGIEIDGAPAPDPARARHWILNLHPVRGPAGRVRAVGVVAIEMTERKHLERQLVQAQKMEAIGRLAGSIAHDFNNLLTAISAFAQFAREGVDAEAPVREDIDQILLATERGAALTRRLLAFSRQQVVEPRPVDLNRVIEDLDEMLRRLLGADVSLETRLAPDLWRIDADPGQLEQVILNLAVNARDAMPEGGVIVVETAMAELDASTAGRYGDVSPGPHVVLTVSDTGTGMDAATQARAFEPFFTTKPIGKGTGLGLSTVYGIVRQFRGSIAFDSEVGRGTTFRIVFPRSAEQERTPSDEVPSTDAARLPPVSVLLVEDDVPVRSAAHRTLKNHGCTVHEAPNGRDALELLERLGGWVHLVITDLVMPEMGGLEFAREVRKKSPTTRILFISGYAADARLRRTLAETGAYYLAKPFTAATLVARVREAIGGDGSTAAA
jgi:two-component system cell cycle sensor histidine kinase/response regulator CckA